MGATYLIRGPITEDTDLSFAHVRYIGSGNGEESGSSIANAGDFDGDGLDDALIGAPTRLRAKLRRRGLPVLSATVTEGVSRQHSRVRLTWARPTFAGTASTAVTKPATLYPPRGPRR